MSRGWHLHCRDCRSQTEVDINHGQDMLLQMIADAPVLLAAMNCKSWDWPLMMESSCGRGELLEFLKSHQGHSVAPIDEYGRSQ